MDYDLYLASGEKSTQIATKKKYVRTPARLRAGTMLTFPTERTIGRAAQADIVLIS